MTFNSPFSIFAELSHGSVQHFR